MRIVDANVLIYAVNADAEHHDASRRWLDRALSGGDTVGLSWVALLAYVRIATRSGLLPRPISTAAALRDVSAWIGAPSAVVVQPGPGHADILDRLLDEVGTGGNLVNDAHLAALAVEQRASIVSYDADFGRFRSLRSYRPEELLTG